MTVINPFMQKSEAERYDLYRPIYHDIPFQKLNKHLGFKFKKSIDVCCGTGHSTNAISKISENVVGCDLSLGMLAVARKNLPIEFIQTPAEQMPFSNGEFDFLNISMGIHWLNQDHFLNEAHRLLAPKGFLSIDNYGFIGQMINNPNFLEQYKKFDSLHFPAAQRNSDYPTDEKMLSHGFKIIHEIRYEHEVKMDMIYFNNYLMTRSNFLILSHEQQNQMPQLLSDYYSPIFNNQDKVMVFRGLLKLYHK
jgi:ubiquinone/menaquinone biosynthesis C-methylase UbiE